MTDKSLNGLRVLVKALGCRTNLYEADAISSSFDHAGATLVQRAPFDVAVLVSCTVTSEADRKSRQIIRRFKRSCPDSLVVATGCWAQKLDKSSMDDLPVDILVGNRHKHQIIELVSRALNDHKKVCLQSDVMRDKTWDSLKLDHPHFHSRAFLKVQDGCDHFCSYCIIPYVRGKSVSRPIDDVEEEVRSVVKSGCGEIVLTGVHLGLYGKDNSSSLSELVTMVSSIEGVKRIRFGSLEPFSVDKELISVLSQTGQFCRHLHLPLQSGSDKVLSMMKRGHSASDFIELVDSLRSYLGEDLHISTDILVGFPGEDESDFQDTLAVLKRCSIGRIHSFPYSPREGTPAVRYKDRPDRSIAESRCKEVISLGEELLTSYCQRWLGRTVSLMVEENSENLVKGYIPEFIRMESIGKAPIGEEVLCLVESIENGELRGRVV